MLRTVLKYTGGVRASPCGTVVLKKPSGQIQVVGLRYASAKQSDKRDVYVVGVGMTKFEKPGRRKNFDYPDMALEAGKRALEDARIDFSKVEQAAVGYCYGDTTCGQRAVYELGMTGIPIYNVNNACATGSTALMLGKQLVEGGQADCIMALGFEKMEKGSLGMKYTDRCTPYDKHMGAMSKLFPLSKAPFTAQLFGNAGIEHMKKYGTKPEHFAKVAWKNHKHSVNNPNSQFQDEHSVEDIMKSPSIHDFLTKLQCCPTSDGAGCAILASEEFVKEHGLESRAIKILAQVMTTDYQNTFTDRSVLSIVGYDMSKKAAEKLFKQAKLTPSDVDVCELHDCFSVNELITYEALGLCQEGKAGEFIDKGDNTYGGKVVVNPSGGLISKGHPLGATGLAQCAELCWQLRGEAGKRQVPSAKTALQHNLGLGGAAVLTLYRHGYPNQASHAARQLHTSAHRMESSESDFKSKTSFDDIGKLLKTKGEQLVKNMNGVYCFKVKSDDKEGFWILDLKTGTGSLKFSPTEIKGDVQLAMDDESMKKLMSGQLDPQMAFFQGKLKIAGNMKLAMKLSDLIPKGE